MLILAISGSLRARSRNTSLLRALIQLAQPPVEIALYEELHLIPPFNPDHEATHGFEPVTRFQEALRAAAAVVISTPEYAHGIPGQLKNALDWVVGTGELSEKPVALVNASARAEYARSSLKEVLTTMNARLISDAEVTVDLPGPVLTPAQILEDRTPWMR